MDIQRLYKKLKHYDPALYESQGNCTSFTSIKFLVDNTLVLDPCILYIGKTSSLEEMIPYLDRANILCLKDTDLSEEALEDMSINLIILDKIVDIPMLFNEVYDILFINQRITKETGLLSDSFAQKNNLGDIFSLLEMGYNIINNPIAVCSLDGIILANKNLSNIPNLSEYSFGRLFSGDNLDDLYRSSEQISNNASKFSVDIAGVDYNILAGKIICEGNVSAYMLVIEFEKSFSDSDIEIVSQLCKAFSLEIGKRATIQNLKKDILFDKLLVNLLNENIDKYEIINEWIKNIDISFNKFFHVLTIKMYDLNSKGIKINELKKLPGVKVIVYEGNLVLLINNRINEFSIGDVSKNIIEFMKKNDLRGGLSRYFNNISDLNFYYKQSLKAIEMGIISNKEEIVYVYDNYVIYHMLDMLPRDMDIKEFCHPSLLELLEYDRKNNTQYTYTLYTLLLAKGKQVDASNNLHIHRSTMVYRMEKIEELSGLNPYELKDIVRLYFSFIILKMLNILDPEEYTGIF
jgi:hypothetical protein